MSTRLLIIVTVALLASCGTKKIERSAPKQGPAEPASTPGPSPTPLLRNSDAQTYQLIQEREVADENRQARSELRSEIKSAGNHQIKKQTSIGLRFAMHESVLETPSMALLSSVARFLKEDPRSIVTIEISVNEFQHAIENDRLVRERVQTILRVLLEKGVNAAQTETTLLKPGNESVTRLRLGAR